MTSENLELLLLQIILFLFGIIILLFIARTIKILTTKSISSKEDVLCVLFWIVFLLPFAIAYYFISRKFKKEKKCENNCEITSLKK
jgi:uncharacterized protein YneF (UPF0154 family)